MFVYEGVCVFLYVMGIRLLVCDLYFWIYWIGERIRFLVIIFCLVVVFRCGVGSFGLDIKLCLVG